ncbi:MAG TPA: hypothetical protein VF393_07730 [archaeon]
MNRKFRRLLCECESVGELALAANDNDEVWSGNASFTVSQEIIIAQIKDGIDELPSLRDVSGMLYPQDDESAHKILKQFESGRPFMIRGLFKDRRSGAKSNFALHGVLISRFDMSSGCSFHANSIERL